MRKIALIAFLLNDNQKSFLDIAPSVQFIFNSQARVDIGYRRQLYSTMTRTAPNGIVFKFEYLLLMFLSNCCITNFL